MKDLEQRILEIITANPGQKAKDIASQLGVGRDVVNSALYGELRSRVRQDKSYKWYPKDGFNDISHEEPIRLNTPLARLCRYYLDCLSHDDLDGVSEFARSQFGDPKYVELTALPFLNEEETDPLESEAGRRLLGRMRRDRNRQTLYLGYPVRLNLIHSRKGWEGFLVEPLLLFPFQEAEDRYGKPTLSDEMPQINLKALQSLTHSGDSSLMEEAIQLTEELGLSNVTEDNPEIDELLARLCELRTDWDWQEGINPHELSSGEPLSAINQQGIFNRAILIAAERSPYTKGLETELGKLQLIEEDNYSETILGSWLDEKHIESPPSDEEPLVEVLPLNSEQRQAVCQAITNPLTVITGPPGTGKSQVVSSILVNAAWRGLTVLFASKNNKAVDVVEVRVNALGPRPVLLRLGANAYQSRLAEYLVSLLAASATADDLERYNEHQANHIQLQFRSDTIDSKIKSIIDIRNEVDRLEQKTERFRSEVGDEIFQSFRTININTLHREARKLQSFVNKASFNAQSIITKIIWLFIRKNRFAQLSEAARAFHEIAIQINFPIPEVYPDASTITEWRSYGDRLAGHISQVEAANEYFGKMESLINVSLEDLSKQRKGLIEDLTSNSEALWQLWLRLQPSRLEQKQRKLLGDYSALLQMVVSANENNQQLGRDVFRRYYQLFPQITTILPCWAVTSLSARGRIPFESNFFDLLVIDEASQCDIASALPLLYRARRVVVIGDPMQLRHISTLSKQKDQQLLSKHELVDDYAGWAYSTRSLFDLASSICRSEDIVVLRDHHRSHADIIEFSNKAFYEGRLRVATNYNRLRRPNHNGPAVRWINVKGKTIRPGSGGAQNESEARCVIEEIERLIAQGYDGSIGVVSPFRAQANLIRDLANANKVLAHRIADMDFLVDTVHKFQGDERDVIIFSPVVSTGISTGAIGFLRSTPNLFNVAITRARAALIVVGDQNAALNCDVDYLAQFAAYVDIAGRNALNDPSTIENDHGPEYPPVSNPEKVSEWERIFYRALYRAGIRPVPQYAVEKYVLDFALLDGERRLNIEIDGELYHRNWDGELCRRDQIRNQRLIELGWDVMRFWVYQIRDDMDACIERVHLWLGQDI